MKCQMSGQYGKDDNKEIHFYCDNCGEEMDYNEDKECKATPNTMKQRLEDAYNSLEINAYINWAPKGEEEFKKSFIKIISQEIQLALKKHQEAIVPEKKEFNISIKKSLAANLLEARKIGENFARQEVIDRSDKFIKEYK